jgi:hypothetical protein
MAPPAPAYQRQTSAKGRRWFGLARCLPVRRMPIGGQSSSAERHEAVKPNTRR